MEQWKNVDPQEIAALNRKVFYCTLLQSFHLWNVAWGLAFDFSCQPFVKKIRNWLRKKNAREKLVKKFVIVVKKKKAREKLVWKFVIVVKKKMRELVNS